MQDEFHFYLEDASSKLLLVPAKGNSKAQQAAEQLRVPVATLSLSESGELYDPAASVSRPGALNVRLPVCA